MTAARGERRIRYRVKEAGPGPTLTLLHPIGLDGSWWEPLAAEVAGHARTIIVDLAGHGETDAAPRATFPALAADVRTVWELTGTTSSTVVGVSMGGMVAQELAVSGPGVEGLVLVCTAASFDDAARAAIRARAHDVDSLGMAALADATVERWFSPELVQRHDPLVETARRDLAAGRADVHRECWRMISEVDFVDRLAAVTAPTVVLAGEADASVPVKAARTLAGAIPQAELEMVPDGSHMFAFERRGWLPRAVSRVHS